MVNDSKIKRGDLSASTVILHISVYFFSPFSYVHMIVIIVQLKLIHFSISSTQNRGWHAIGFSKCLLTVEYLFM